MMSLRFTLQRSVGFAASVALVGSLLVSAGADAKPDTQCHIRNARLHSHYVTLQSAVDAASAGDTLRVKGTCVGTTTIAKELTIDGQPKATLDGNSGGSVVTIAIGRTSMSLWGTVTMRDLVITHGRAPDGGGIRFETTNVTLIRTTVTANTASSIGGGIAGALAGGTLTLDDSNVTANSATSGGGLYTDHGSIVLNGTSSVHDNMATVGGGIAFFTAETLTLNGTSSVHDNTATVGGGISVGDATAVLNDSASIYNNRADRGAGVSVGRTAQGFTLNSAASIHDNTAATSGGGIYTSSHGPGLTNCVAGVNVLANAPDDIFVEP